MGTRSLTVNDVLAGHVTPDIECLDRIYVNGYVANLQDVPSSVELRWRPVDQLGHVHEVILAWTSDSFGDLALERGAQRAQVQVAVDAAELLAGLDHPGGAPAQRHLPVAPALDVARAGPADRDHALDRVGRAQRARERRGARPAAARSTSRSCLRAGWRLRPGGSCPARGPARSAAPRPRALSRHGRPRASAAPRLGAVAAAACPGHCGSCGLVKNQCGRVALSWPSASEWSTSAAVANRMAAGDGV
jgi:hypothetical protein